MTIMKLYPLIKETKNRRTGNYNRLLHKTFNCQINFIFIKIRSEKLENSFNRLHLVRVQFKVAKSVPTVTELTPLKNV